MTERHALRILNSVTLEITPLFAGDDAPAERQFTFGGYSYRVKASQAAKPGVYPPAVLESAKPASEVRRKDALHWHEQDGVGAALSPTWKRPADPQLQRFVGDLGYIEPLTAVLAFDRETRRGAVRTATLTAYDPTAVANVRIGRADYPLAADYTAPIVDRTKGLSEFWLSIGGLLNADTRDASLRLLEPYDPNRIPVVLVHGLKSHPKMWRDAINDLRADPELRGRYQFWVFSYPSGWPIAYSAMRLREELAALDALVGPQRNMLLIGHSMGGLLSRMQVVTPDRALWDAVLGERADAAYSSLAADSLVKRSLLFRANPEVERVVFISVPQRGSSMADMTLAEFFARLVRLPVKITAAVAAVPGNVLDGRPIASITALSPGNPLFAGLETVPIEVPYHSIVGDRGKGGNPDRTKPISTDGVVAYWSSHLDGAKSELIVPSDHGAYDDPQAMDEMKRILKLHLKIATSSTP